MKKTAFILSFFFITSLIWAQSDSLNTIEFINKTKGEIYYLFCSPGDSDYWGPDVLGESRTLYGGERVEFYISYPEETGLFDFMAIDEFGNVYEIYDQEITDGTPARVTISKAVLTDQQDLDTLTSDLVALEISNTTGFELFYLFISPSDSEMYGIDFMDSETTLADGDSIRVLFFNSDTDIEYDVQGIDEDNDSYSFSLSLDPELDDQIVEITFDDLDT